MSVQMKRPEVLVSRFAAAMALAVITLTAQTPPAASLPSFTAVTDNVGGAHDAIKINLLRWSTDAERDQLFAAWTRTGAKGPAGAGRGGGRGPAAPARRSARDGLRGGEELGAAQTPERSLSTELTKVPTVGFLWSSSEVLGYSVHYAGRFAEPDGGERIILITDRPLGSGHSLWKLAGPGPLTSYDFSVIELRLNAKGEGEGKVSITGKVSPDAAAKVLALDNYSGLPVLLGNVKRRIG